MKQSGKRTRDVDIIVDASDTVSPGSRERTGLIALMARAVGCERSARKTKESANAYFNLILFPRKLPKPTYISQNDNVIPISSSLPENVERRRRNTVICRSIEVKPMIEKGMNVLSCITLTL